MDIFFYNFDTVSH